MKFSELQRLQRREGITVLSADERIEQLEARLRTITKERDALRAKVERMERQEPVARFNWNKGKLEWLRPWNYSIMNMKPLYLAPGAQPAPSVPEGWQLVPTAESRHPGIYKMLGALHAADNTPGISEWESYRAMLAAAPEAKP